MLCSFHVALSFVSCCSYVDIVPGERTME